MLLSGLVPLTRWRIVERNVKKCGKRYSSILDLSISVRFLFVSTEFRYRIYQSEEALIACNFKTGEFYLRWFVRERTR